MKNREQGRWRDALQFTCFPGTITKIWKGKSDSVTPKGVCPGLESRPDTSISSHLWKPPLREVPSPFR